MAAEPSRHPGVQQAKTETDDLVVAIVEAVAAAKDTDPVDLDARLAEKIDLDALATAYASASRHPDTKLTLEFTVDGCTVTVRSDGEIAVSEPTTATA